MNPLFDNPVSKSSPKRCSLGLRSSQPVKSRGMRYTGHSDAAQGCNGQVEPWQGMEGSFLFANRGGLPNERGLGAPV